MCSQYYNYISIFNQLFVYKVNLQHIFICLHWLVRYSLHCNRIIPYGHCGRARRLAFAVNIYFSAIYILFLQFSIIIVSIVCLILCVCCSVNLQAQNRSYRGTMDCNVQESPEAKKPCKGILKTSSSFDKHSVSQ